MASVVGRGGRVLLGTVLAVAAAGCDWGMPRGDAARTGNVAETVIGVGNVAELEQAWVVDTGAAQPAGPVTAAGAVVVLDGDSAQAYEAGTGAVRWDTALPPFPFPELGHREWSAPSAHGATVFVGFGDPLTSGGSSGGFARFDALTGEVTGTDTGGGGGSFVPVSAASFVGQDRWFAGKFVTPSPPQGFAGPVGQLDSGRTVTSITEVGGSGATAGTPAVAGGMVYFARPQGGFVDAIDAAGVEGCTTFGSIVDCRPLWSAPVTGSPSVAASGARVFTSNGGASGGIAAYATGPTVRGPNQQPLWQAAVPGATSVALTPSADATSVLVGSSDGTLRAYAAAGCGSATCSPVWQSAVGGAVGAPVIANGVVYVTSSDGQVHAFASAGCGAATCDPLWSAATPGTPASVIVANGRVFVTTTSGDLVAYAIPT